ncbi:MAG: glycosyltransferase, partial [Lachnospiraceae bacterium]|nr:glycosyltransferase [Lachnospiraceae bacterium]
MMKDLLRQVLYKRDQRLYEAELNRQKVSYDAWIRSEQRNEAGERIVAESSGEVQLISYDQVEAFCKGDGRENSFLTSVTVFYAPEGTVAPKAPQLFLNYFKNRPNVDLCYGDEAVMEADGTFGELHFKPCWSPDTYLSAFYIGTIFALRENLLQEVLSDVQEGIYSIQNADELFYRAALKTGGFARRKGRVFPIGHVDEILYHRTKEQDPYYGRGFDAPMLRLPGEPDSSEDLISIIIPSKDHPDVLSLCLHTILEKTGESRSIRNTGDAGGSGCSRVPLHYEVIVVDNGSSGANRIRVQSLLTQLFPDNSLYCYESMPFNFSRMCNLGAEKAHGNYLLFLNDDIEIASENWLEELYIHAKREYVGAAGIKLLYPEEGDHEGKALIQHAGITNLSVGPTHKLQRLSDHTTYYYGFNRGCQDRIGVTAACLLVSREKFEKAECFYEGLAVAFNDVDLNFTLFEQGYYNVVCNNVFLYHHESLSRGNDFLDDAKTKRLLGEMALLQKRHSGWEYYDPFYNRHLSGSSMEEINPEIDDLPEDRLKEAKKIDLITLGTYREDGCLLLTVDYAGDITKLFSEARDLHQESGFCIKGFGIIVGSDNACYDRYLLLRDVVNHDLMYAFDLYDWYRPDVEKNLHGQVNVGLTGFKCRIGKDQLPAGEYE